MLDDFILSNRDAIIARARLRVASRRCPKPTDVELANGIPVFLDQLCEALRLAELSDVSANEQISKSAGLHGHDLLRMGLTIGQVVHDYGDVCQTITALAIEQEAPISGEEFRTLNLCLDDAIAEAVTEYSRHRELAIAALGTERLGILAHELRNLLNTATLTFGSIKSGRVAVGGSTGVVHARSLLGLRDLIDRSLAEVRIDAGIENHVLISAAEFVEEVEIGALLQAEARGLRFAVTPVDRAVMIEGDRQILAAALSNLLQNAFKFTREHSNVSLTTRVTADRVLFEVEDECGGLPPGKTEELFHPFEQRGSDRTGVGLGLAICRKAARANASEIHVRDLPGKGCVFTLDLPRKPPPPCRSSVEASAGRARREPQAPRAHREPQAARTRTGPGRPSLEPSEKAETMSISEPLSADLLRKLDAYWRAANYLSVGQIYLLDNPLLKEPLRLEHVKPRLLGHWGTTPGLNFIYVHMNRIIKERGLEAIYIAGPGHGGPGVVANTYLEGTYSEVYPAISPDEEGMKALFRQFSFPGGIPSHVAPETPGSIHEGGELGYSLSHAFGAAFDNPNLFVCCVVGDGEAETGPLATSWHSNKFLNPARDGAVLPILHLNGYKIAGPTVLARIPREELCQLLVGYGYAPLFVEGDEPARMHQKMAAALDAAASEIHRIQTGARADGDKQRPRWPMIVLRSPKGWTGPKEVDGVKVEGTFRAHQVPLAELAQKPGHLQMLEAWMKSYRPEELFDERGRLVPELAELPPKGEKRMSASPHANGGLLLRDLKMPDFRAYAVDVPEPGTVMAEATRAQGRLVRDVIKLNDRTFRVFSPDETTSNRWGDVFEATSRQFTGEILPGDDHVAPEGRVMEMLSEHQCQGWLEGYLLTGRHGFFSCYEAFIHIVDSMFNQHAKWLKTARDIPWRRPIASLNYLLTSHVWRQDHNGFSHQDPGFIDHVINKKADVIRVYLPPDANTLLSVTDHCLRSRGYVNVIVAGKQPALQWLGMDEAVKHCTAGIGIWGWASSDQGAEPDVVMACAGDVPTLETLAAAQLLKQHLPELKIRVINVVDLMKLQPPSEHPHGLPDRDFDAMFTKDRPVLFAYHGYPWLIHRLTYRRTNHGNLHVRGYKEEGTTTTPFDMAVRNDMDRFHLVGDVVDRLPQLGSRVAYIKQAMRDKLIEHKRYITEKGDDMPEVRDFRWGA